MKNRIRYFLVALLSLFLITTRGLPADREAVVQRTKTELATLLKKDATKLPVDRPVHEFGADELTVVEWVMALERAYKINIPNSATADPKTKKVRKDISISQMAAAVTAALQRPKK